MSFLELLKPQNDKVTLSEMILAKQNLPERVERAIPACMYHSKEEGGGLDYEVFRVFVWIVARREAPDITIEEAGDRIGMRDEEALTPILKQVVYFFSSFSHEQVTESFAKDRAAREAAEAGDLTAMEVAEEHVDFTEEELQPVLKSS